MRYHALACDFDGTIADDGRVTDDTLSALERLSRSGRRLLLVTGRELDDLLDVFPHTDLFDMVVAENGGLLYDPAERTRHALAEPPPAAFTDRLRAAGADPLGVGEVMVATREPYDTDVHAAVRDLGLELEVAYNKGAVMVLPPGVNKASGLAAGLARLEMSPRSTVAVGDAENDHAMLAMCECAVAVANALDAVKERCDLVLDRPRGEGVTDLAALLIDTDLDGVRTDRHRLTIGTAGEEPAAVEPYGTALAIAGPSGSGKSTAATALIERLGKAGYQHCLIDPEGDYSDGDGGLVLGDPNRAPSADEVVRTLTDPTRSVAVNMLGVPLRDRPAFYADLLPRLAGLRARLGHPHWIVVDEAHHLMPRELAHLPIRDLADVGSLLMITVHPESLSPLALRLVDTVVAVGDRPGDTLDAFAEALDRPAPELETLPDDAGGGATHVSVWHAEDERAREVELVPGERHSARHRRKYAAGTMSPEKSFYFTGPDERLRLRARNLHAFLDLGAGVDDDTWCFHLRRGDYSAWMRDAIGDDELADRVADAEAGEGGPKETREEIARLVNERYTLPAEPTRYDPDHDDDAPDPTAV
jgi:hydroxymethylpyrimidine pyrophosphatase-like HAD family hydrolase/DNA polymerase III delta prime subunit